MPIHLLHLINHIFDESPFIVIVVVVGYVSVFVVCLSVSEQKVSFISASRSSGLSIVAVHLSHLSKLKIKLLLKLPF